MDTQNLPGMENTRDDGQSGMGSASQSCDGLPSESKRQTVAPLMGSYFEEADPINLCKAICIVYDRWIRQGKKPGSDRIANSTRKHRPALVAEIEAEWCVLAGVEFDDDIFPYHESYVIRKWIDFRKQNDCVKTAWIAASKA